MKQRQSFGGGMGLLILVMLLIMLFSTRNQSMFMPGKISYPEFMMNVENGSISRMNRMNIEDNLFIISNVLIRINSKVMLS